jgi:hypothetical protein
MNNSSEFLPYVLLGYVGGVIDIAIVAGAFFAVKRLTRQRRDRGKSAHLAAA